MTISRETCLSFSFYLIQLFFNFFKYSSLNFLLSYPNKIFAIYFSSDSLFLNISAFRFDFFFFFFSFLICTLFISSSLISFSNSSTKPIAFSKFSNLSYVSSSTIYFFYLTKYFGFLFISLLFNIFSTLYSFSPFISTGGDRIFFYPSTCF